MSLTDLQLDDGAPGRDERALRPKPQIVILVQKYARERDRFEKMAATVARHLSARLRADLPRRSST